MPRRILGRGAQLDMCLVSKQGPGLFFPASSFSGLEVAPGEDNGRATHNGPCHRKTSRSETDA